MLLLNSPSASLILVPLLLAHPCPLLLSTSPSSLHPHSIKQMTNKLFRHGPCESFDSILSKPKYPFHAVQLTMVGVGDIRQYDVHYLGVETHKGRK
ncbi:hypothetical protein K504DRAFT_52560 [Pleomassaria siparia CBS 279.74]|uniref:Uncharacterized protein n=1 Tax=Pleomassaria siparia CBS 279.74 TaxID=1314801 RepID=A0A6G1K339_9PLEO|nr:hypothetical protein K504DRAFT_52560 [Pleomassaria siparia CBS 279.74]